MYFRACDCPKGHHKHPGADPACCALSTAAAGLGGHFQPARDPGAFYQRSPASGFGAIEASNIGPVITRREMRGRTNRTRAMWTNNAEVMGNAIHGFGEDAVSTREVMPTVVNGQPTCPVGFQLLGPASPAPLIPGAPIPSGGGGSNALTCVYVPFVDPRIPSTIPTTCPAGQIGKPPFCMSSVVPSLRTAPPTVAFPACPAGQMWNPTAGVCEVRIVAPGAGTPGEQCFVGGGKWDAQTSVCTMPPSVPPAQPVCPAPANISGTSADCGPNCYYYCPTKSCVPYGISTPAIMPGQCGKWGTPNTKWYNEPVSIAGHTTGLGIPVGFAAGAVIGAVIGGIAQYSIGHKQRYGIGSAVGASVGVAGVLAFFAYVALGAHY
jgi:hypothetical protein